MIKHFLTFFVVGLVVCFTMGSTGLHAGMQVGEDVVQRLETPHPYGGSTGVVWEREFHWPNAGYIALHFSSFDLAPGDFLVISSPDGMYSYTYEGQGKVVRGGETVLGTFWATHIPGDTLIARLVSKNGSAGDGFVIDKWVRGFERQFILAATAGVDLEEANEIIATKDWAVQIEEKVSLLETKNKAVAQRLLTNGKYASTGFLIGCEGHLMTTYKSIGSQEDADNTDYEFMTAGSMDGVVVAGSGTLVKANEQLDYALIKLPENITETYGYLQFRQAQPEPGDNIYIPTQTGLPGSHTGVVSETGEPSAPVFQAYVSSNGNLFEGAPVLAELDDFVVAMNVHSGDGIIDGVPVEKIILDLGSDLPEDAISTVKSVPQAPTPMSPTGGQCIATLTPVFKWYAVTASPSVDKYQVKCLKSNGIVIFNNEVGNVTQYTCPSPLPEGTEYYWRVRAHNANGWGAYSVKAWFKTRIAPDPPGGRTPCGGTSTTTTPTLSWNAATTSLNCPSGNAEKYRVKIFRVSDGALVKQENNVQALSYTVPANTLEANKQYKWEIQAYNSWGWGDWSDFCYFWTNL